MRNPTAITTDLAVDAPLVQDADHEFDDDDRQYIDNQVRGVQQHLVDLLIRGQLATYYFLDGGSSGVVPGDTVCRAASASGSVSKSTAALLAAAKTGTGVVINAAAPGGRVLVATGGVLAPSVTGLASASAFVRINQTTSRLESVSAINACDFAMGAVDDQGYMLVAPQLVSGSTLATASGGIVRARRYAVAPGDTRLIRAVIKVQMADGSGANRGEWDVHAAYSRTPTTLAQEYDPIITESLNVGSIPGPSFVLNGNTDVDLKVRGLDSTNLIWSISEFIL